MHSHVAGTLTNKQTQMPASAKGWVRTFFSFFLFFFGGGGGQRSETEWRRQMLLLCFFLFVSFSVANTRTKLQSSEYGKVVYVQFADSHKNLTKVTNGDRAMKYCDHRKWYDNMWPRWNKTWHSEPRSKMKMPLCGEWTSCFGLFVYINPD